MARDHSLLKCGFERDSLIDFGHGQQTNDLASARNEDGGAVSRLRIALLGIGSPLFLLEIVMLKEARP